MKLLKTKLAKAKAKIQSKKRRIDADAEQWKGIMAGGSKYRKTTSYKEFVAKIESKKRKIDAKAEKVRRKAQAVKAKADATKAKLEKKQKSISKKAKKAKKTYKSIKKDFQSEIDFLFGTSKKKLKLTKGSYIKKNRPKIKTTGSLSSSKRRKSKQTLRVK